ncbi:ATP-dependent zinc metalloprotease FtsH [Ruminococcaceae bacterium OttesenSCG-928-N02]|nr:ATP-dependent zinc metalloprotease FtsH [Ruminococcaceae bacterium OttesenSCG-928-N02]
MVKQRKPSNLSMMMLIFGLMAIALFFWDTGEAGHSYKYSEIIQQFEDQKVTSFVVDLGTGEAEFTIRGEEEPLTYKIPHVTLFLNTVGEYIDEYNQAHPNAPMEYDYIPANVTPWWYSLVPTLIMVVLLVAFWYFMYMQQSGGGKAMQVGRAKVKNQTESGRKATFADVAGADEEKSELAELVDFLKNPQRYSQLGARIPRGVMLVGPPGTGKTLLARSVAGEAGVPFYSISGSDFVEMYVGVGASRVRDLFDKARKTAPCIIFIDEIDAVGRQRGAGLGGGHDEREQTLNQLLVEMDGFGDHQGVIVIAATNRADILDKALLRPGRFDRMIYVGLPDMRGRAEILKVHMRGKPIGPDVIIENIARRTIGFSGADLENLMNEAALLAARAKRKAIIQKDIDEASMKVIAGPEKKSHAVTEKERKLTAFHEGGHAVVAYFSNPEHPVHEISIIPRGQMGGYTLSLPLEDTSFVTRNQMLGNIEMSLGGRVAEELVLGDISTGASNDLERATSTAKSMVMRYGFSEKLGPVVYGQDQQETFLGRDFSQGRAYSEAVASEIDNEVRDIIESAYDRVRNILREHMPELEKLAGMLLEQEKVSGEEFAKLMEDFAKPAQPSPQANEDIAQEAPAKKKRAPRAKKAEVAVPATEGTEPSGETDELAQTAPAVKEPAAKKPRTRAKKAPVNNDEPLQANAEPGAQTGADEQNENAANKQGE